jgi:hypothetical protein
MIRADKEKKNMTINPQDLKAIITKMQQLEDAVQKCAPNPDTPEKKGFLYAKSDSRTSGDSESLLGSMIADHVFGCGLGFMSEGLVGDLDAGHLIEAYDEFQVERGQAKENKARNALHSFNAACLGSEHKAREVAFSRDLPKRVKLEHAYIRLSRDLDELETQMEMEQSLKHEFDFEQKIAFTA